MFDKRQLHLTDRPIQHPITNHIFLLKQGQDNSIRLPSSEDLSTLLVPGISPDSSPFKKESSSVYNPEEISRPLPQMQPIPEPTASESTPPIEIYSIYVRQDVKYFEKIIERIYGLLEVQRYNVSCHACDVTQNFAWQQRDHLKTARLIILLVSPDFLRADICYHEQMSNAVKRHLQNQNKCSVMPILVRPTLPVLLRPTSPGIRKPAFGELAFLPSNGKAVSEWRPFDLPFNDIAQHIFEKIDTLKYY
jgi:hypothetical protein